MSGKTSPHLLVLTFSYSDADVGVFDASDVYTGGLTYDLIPFIAEVYNLGKPEYYVVAVGRENDPSTELTFLRGTLKKY